MDNLAMEALLKTGEAVDVSGYEKTPEGWYKIPDWQGVRDLDLCVASIERWIHSVGKNLATGEVFASTTNVFYPPKNGWECVWLR